jgi:hypothetical protein
MRALAVLPIVVAVGAWDPCEPWQPDARAIGNSPQEVQLLNTQLRLSGCVAQHVPRAMLHGSRAQARAVVRRACVGDAVASRTMSEAQASALADRLVDQEIDFLTRCQE